MRKNLVLGALMLMIVATNSLSDMGPTCTSNMSVDSDSTVLTYFIEHVPAQSEDYIEIVLEVLTHSGRLVEALASAQKTVEEIQSLAKEYCKEHTRKGKGDCKEAIQIGKFNIDPKYQIVRKEAIFSAFNVKHVLTIKVFNVDSLGMLADEILKKPGTTIKSFEWTPLLQKHPEEAAIKQGIEEGEGLCDQLGFVMSRIIEVQEVREDEEEDEKKEEKEGAEEKDEEESNIVYRFKVECVKGKKGSKKSKSKAD